MPELATLPDDILEMLDKGKNPDLEKLEAFGREVAAKVGKKIREGQYPRNGEPKLYMSSIGKPDRKLWYEHNRTDLAIPIDGKLRLRFILGDIIELLILYLAEEAGHEVTHRQELVEVDGVRGKMDAKIDGKVVDVKSASPYGYKKFRDGSLLRGDDPFGYMYQLGGYDDGHPEGAEFLAVDKSSGETTLLGVSRERLDGLRVRERIATIKEVIKQPEPPARCYDDIPEGKSGNRVLAFNCELCDFKKECWKTANNGKGLRAFKYFNKIKYATVIEREPNVEEVPVE